MEIYILYIIDCSFNIIYSLCNSSFTKTWKKSANETNLYPVKSDTCFKLFLDHSVKWPASGFKYHQSLMLFLAFSTSNVEKTKICGSLNFFNITLISCNGSIKCSNTSIIINASAGNGLSIKYFLLKYNSLPRYGS